MPYYLKLLKIKNRPSTAIRIPKLKPLLFQYSLYRFIAYSIAHNAAPIKAPPGADRPPLATPLHVHTSDHLEALVSSGAQLYFEESLLRYKSMINKPSSLVSTDVTMGKRGHKIPGAEKSQQCCKYLLQYSKFTQKRP